MYNKLKIAFRGKKWYLQPLFISLCFSFWFLIIPLFTGIILLAMYYKDNYNKNLKYGEFEKIDETIEKLKKDCDLKEKELTQKMNDNEIKLANEVKHNEDIVARLLQKIEALNTEKKLLQKEIQDLENSSIVNYTTVNDYSNIPSQEIKNQLNILKIEQDNLINKNLAVNVSTSQTNSNKKMLSANIKQILRSFNCECSLIINNLTIKNIDNSRSKFEKSFYALNKIFELDNVKISDRYYELKLKELTLNFAYLQQYENEKEQQKAIKEQLLEEEKVRKEIEREKLKIEKEEYQFKNEIDKLMSYMQKANNDIEKQLYIKKINELEEKLRELEKDKENVLQREQNTRAGFVYIISNIGSFGENIYKIGMTRRLEPMDRIKELGDASVPFQFDVHALIFSDDAPKLENILHQTFKNNQVNKLNSRKEFYNVDLNKIKETVLNNHNNTVNFTEYAEAYEWRESQKIKFNDV